MTLPVLKGSQLCSLPLCASFTTVSMWHEEMKYFDIDDKENIGFSENVASLDGGAIYVGEH